MSIFCSLDFLAVADCLIEFSHLNSATKEDPICIFPECNKVEQRASFCRLHYDGLRQGIFPVENEVFGLRLNPQCSREGCERLAHTRRPGALCRTHYNQQLPSSGFLGVYRPRGEPCLVEWCEKPCTQKGHCAWHLAQLKLGIEFSVEPQSGYRICEIDQCQRRSNKKAICGIHQKQLDEEGRTWRIGDPYKGLPKPIDIRREYRKCAIDTCEGGATPFGDLCPKCRGRAAGYRMSPERFVQILNGASCQACGSTKKLCIDHDHSCCPESAKSCGRCFRGVLCNSCNAGLGIMEDSVERLLGLVDYLNAHQAQTGLAV